LIQSSPERCFAGGRALWALPLLLWLLTGCAADLSQVRELGVPATSRIENLQPFQQRARHCGPASLSTLLHWAGHPEVTPDDLAPTLYTPGVQGTFLFDMAREARGRGLGVFHLEGGVDALFAEISAGHPVLALENRGLSFAPQYHFSVVAGYDLEAETFVLYEGRAFPVGKPMSDFLRSWDRTDHTALLILPPGRLPVTGSSGSVLGGLAELEGAGQPQAAAQGYAAYVERHPKAWLGHFGRANALHALGRDDEARASFERANVCDPSRPEPLNNLAMLAFTASQTAQAQAFAAQAVQRAKEQGMDPAPYLDTLREVSLEE